MSNPCNGTPTSIMDIPDDCLRHIFRRLETSSDRESFGLTSHRMLQIQNSSRRSLQFHCSFAIFDPTPLSPVSPNINYFHLYRLLTRFRQLSSLSLAGCVELLDSGLTQLQFLGSHLRTLCLDCCFRITDDGLSLVAVGCPSLTSISLYRCNITDIGLNALAKSCFGLQNVNLSYCTQISDHGIESLTKECRQLHAVNISHCKNISGIGFRGCSQTLLYVEAESCKLDFEGIVGVVSGGGLQYLNVSCLSWCIHGDGLSGIGLGYTSSLRILNLRMCRTASNEAVIAIAKGCPSLQEWSLAVCPEVSLPGWKAIGLNCHNLEKLHVNRCQNFCDGGLQSLQNGCKQLSKLYMHRCPRISCLAVELFKRFRGDVNICSEELMFIGPHLPFH